MRPRRRHSANTPVVPTPTISLNLAQTLPIGSDEVQEQSSSTASTSDLMSASDRLPLSSVVDCSTVNDQQHPASSIAALSEEILLALTARPSERLSQSKLTRRRTHRGARLARDRRRTLGASVTTTSTLGDSMASSLDDADDSVSVDVFAIGTSSECQMSDARATPVTFDSLELSCSTASSANRLTVESNDIILVYNSGVSSDSKLLPDDIVVQNHNDTANETLPVDVKFGSIKAARVYEDSSANPQSSFSPLIDCAIVSFFNEICTETKLSLWTLTKSVFVEKFIRAPVKTTETASGTGGDSVLSVPTQLLDIGSDLLWDRFLFLRYFNWRLKSSFNLIGLGTPEESSSEVCSILCGPLRGIIFGETKMSVFDNILSATSTTNRPPVRLSRPKALRSTRDSDPDGLKSIFGQVFSQLRNTLIDRLRSTSERAFQVKLEGEGAQDAGGPYNEILSQLAQELQSDRIGLFIQCPNGRSDTGANREKFIPNPSAGKALHLDMFEFVGKLMGIAIRTKNPLNLQLPSIVWKPLVGESLSRRDLEDIDEMCFQCCDAIRHAEETGVPRDVFEDILCEVFVTTGSDGKEVQLKPNGREISVSWDTKDEFVRLVERFRLSEFDNQVNAMKRGLGGIVPIGLLSLFTWQELDLRVCARPEVDLQLLRRHTRYCSPLHESHPLIDRLWEALESFSSHERRLFLRFVWGRSRLPVTDAQFTRSMEVSLLARSNPDQYLPVAHTCFFQLDLPFFSSTAILREKLLFACTECIEIDIDHQAARGAWGDAGDVSLSSDELEDDDDYGL